MITSLIAAVAVACIAWLGLWWYYQANYAERLVRFDVPNWVMRNSNPNVSYSIAIHKSQIHRYGTLWTATFYPDKHENDQP